MEINNPPQSPPVSRTGIYPAIRAYSKIIEIRLRRQFHIRLRTRIIPAFHIHIIHYPDSKQIQISDRKPQLHAPKQEQRRCHWPVCWAKFFLASASVLTFSPQKLDQLRQHLVNGERPEPARKLGQPRGCLETHSRNLYSPLCGISAPYSVAVARYAALIWNISPTNCETHLAESGFQTPSKNCRKIDRPYMSIYRNR